MKTKNIAICVVGVLALVNAARADLLVIGTATYSGTDYNLIWDDDNNGKSLVWLDYTNSEQYWEDQMAWAAGLNTPGTLTYNLDPQYTVTWTSDWRLPSAGNSPSNGCHAATQEIGHLYYEELGFEGGSVGDGVTAPDLEGSIFENLELTGYWTHTEGDPLFNTEPVWMFHFGPEQDSCGNTVYGYQDIDATDGGFWFFGYWISLAVKHSGIAVREADITVVPVPAAAVLTLLGLSAVGIKLRKYA